MGETLRQLGQLFLQSIPTVILVFVLLVVLDRLFFRPLIDVLKNREGQTVGAMARAREQIAEAEAKSRDYDAVFQAARQEVYRMREVERRGALSERDEALRKAREQSEALLKEAQAVLAAEADRVRRELSGACQSLAGQITQAILSDRMPAGGEERPRL